MTKAIFIIKKKKSSLPWASLKMSKVTFINKEVKTFTKKKTVFKIHICCDFIRMCRGVFGNNL